MHHDVLLLCIARRLEALLTTARHGWATTVATHTAQRLAAASQHSPLPLYQRGPCIEHKRVVLHVVVVAVTTSTVAARPSTGRCGRFPHPQSNETPRIPGRWYLPLHDRGAGLESLSFAPPMRFAPQRWETPPPSDLPVLRSPETDARCGSIFIYGPSSLTSASSRPHDEPTVPLSPSRCTASAVAGSLLHLASGVGSHSLQNPRR